MSNIQILGLRDYSSSDGKVKKAEKFFEKGYRAASVAAILADPDSHLASIPPEEHYNLYFTAAECLEEKGRKLLVQRIIPFDIDGIDKSKVQETWFAACHALGVTPELNGALFSGNGIWIFLNSSVEINDDSYFEAHRLYYKELCHKVNKVLEARGLRGSADPSVWSSGRICRMPNTWNKKPNKEDAKAYTLNPIMSETFDLIQKSGIPILGKEDSITKAFMAGYPSPDANEILSERGCGFLASCKATPNKVTEELWYAMLGILDWLPGGRGLAHDYSRGHRGYSFEETERKAEQARASAGPRTCKNINSTWGKCGSCPHFGKITSPVQIRGKDFIVTEKTGFWSFKTTKDGNVTLGKPEVMDLLKYYKRKTEFRSVIETKELFSYNGKYWEENHVDSLLVYAKEHFNPYVPTHVYDEFKKNVLLTNTVKRDWFHSSTSGKFNLQNGVYDVVKNELFAHSPDFGFTYILPYAFDPHAACPSFTKFLDDVTLRREDLKNTLMEYAGYCLANEESWLQKALFLNGKGANGKSKFTDVLRAVAGKSNVSAQRLEKLGSPINNALLENKLMNISDEASSGAFFASESFKEIVTGGHMTIKKLYKNQYEIENRTKFIMLCNGLPSAADGSHGFFRRLIIVPFEARFDEKTRDPFILDKLLVELPGIFNLIMQHYKNLKDRGTIFESATVNKALVTYMDNSDVALAWLADVIEINDSALPEKFVSTVDVYQEYVQNCQYDWGIKPVSNIKFWQKAEDIFRDLNFSDRRSHVRRAGKQVWIMRGVVRKGVQDEQF